MHICIIGIAGVGKAHALSAAKLIDEKGKGPVHITLVDYEKQLKENLGPMLHTWVNEWGPIRDTYSIVDNEGEQKISVQRVYVGQGQQLPDADLYVISTPNEYHLEYLLQLKGKRVICEKPVIGKGQDIHLDQLINVYLGIEWLYHPKIKEVNQLKSISFVHGYPPEAAMWDSHHEVYDLGSHVISIYQHIKRRDLVYFNSIKKSGRVVTCVTDDGVLLEFGYKKGITTDTVIINDTLHLDWIPFNEGDLFYKQMDHIINGGAPLLSECQVFLGQEALKYIEKGI